MNGVRLLEKAAGDGSVGAKIDIAVCYELGITVERDPKMAFDLMEDARNHAGEGSLYMGFIMYTLSQYYSKGIGTHENKSLSANINKSCV